MYGTGSGALAREVDFASAEEVAAAVRRDALKGLTREQAEALHATLNVMRGNLTGR